MCASKACNRCGDPDITLDRVAQALVAKGPLLVSEIIFFIFEISMFSGAGFLLSS